MDEPKVHHLVGFVQHEDFNVFQRHRALFDQVDQPAWRGDKNINAASQFLLLAENRHAAENAFGLKAKEFAVGAKAFGNLCREFTRWREHQHPAAILLARFRLGRETVERGQRERRRFASAGLCNTAQVAAIEQGRDGLLLDRGRCIISCGFKRLQDGLGKAQVFKIRHKILSK